MLTQTDLNINLKTQDILQQQEHTTYLLRIDFPVEGDELDMFGELSFLLHRSGARRASDQSVQSPHEDDEAGVLPVGV